MVVIFICAKIGTEKSSKSLSNQEESTT